MRASGACARSVASVPAARARSRPPARGPTARRGVAASADERQRVGEEQRAAERQHELTHDLVVEAHARGDYRRPVAGVRVEAARHGLDRVGGDPPGHRPRDPLVDVAGAAHDPLPQRHATRRQAQIGLDAEIRELPVAGRRARRNIGRARPAIDGGRESDHVVRADRHRDPQHLRWRERGAEHRRGDTPIGSSRGCSVAAVALVDRHRRARPEHVRSPGSAPPASTVAAHDHRRASG